MRFPHTPLLLPIVICALLPAAAFAGTAGPNCFESEVAAQMESDGLHVQITLTNWDWGFCWIADPAGVDVYRKTMGYLSCGALVRVTDEPLPWTGLGDVDQPIVLGEFVDASAEANTAYEYVGRPVDAERNALPGENDIVLGYASAGEALIGHGRLSSSTGCTSQDAWIDLCEQECFGSPFINSAPAEVWSHFNDGVTYSVYGEFTGLSEYRFCNLRYPVATITRVVPGLCIVATEPVSWGVVKSKYR
jgi:hypothetical protein